MKHLTQEQRYKIDCMLGSNYTQKEIATKLKVHASTISREIHRNSDKRSSLYKAQLAQHKYERRKKRKSHVIHFTNPQKELVKLLLSKGYSPEQIKGRMKKERVPMVSHETIYLWIWSCKQHGGNLHLYLRRNGRKHVKRGALTAGRGFIKNRIDIDERPDIVDSKSRVGDLEIDTIIGRNHKGAILTINDRLTGKVWIRNLSGKEAAPLAEMTIKVLSNYKDDIHTITADNGKEFAHHQRIASELDINFYFCKPYHSWERGANENTNGLIRQYIPKKTDFANISDDFIQTIEDILNNRPRKRLGYLTPNEKYNLIMNQKIAFAS